MDDYSAARSGLIPPLPWPTFSPPFSALLGDLGQSNMPAFGDQLDDEQIWAVLSFIKAQWPLEVQRMQSQRNPS